MVFPKRFYPCSNVSFNRFEATMSNQADTQTSWQMRFFSFGYYFYYYFH
jgi:hypothetical protein